MFRHHHANTNGDVRQIMCKTIADHTCSFTAMWYLQVFIKSDVAKIQV
jgi:hypothetical protein